MDLGLAGRVAIVGGAGLEVGKHVAMSLASEEIGEMVAFLASEKTGYLTGATISVDGGQTP